MQRAQSISYSFIEVVAAMLQAAYQGVRDAFAAYREARSRAIAARELERLSDHILRDIGLHRSQIHAGLLGRREP
jgi:uncharacterized protein YjiS (DUF1127 family)